MTEFWLYLLICALMVLAIIGVPALATLKQDKQAAFTAVITCLLFITAAFELYGWVGSPHIVPAIKERQQRLAELRESMTQLHDRVQKDPKDLAAWLQLAQNFLETGQFSAAQNAYKQCVLLSGGAPPILLAYAKTLTLEADGKVIDAAKKAFEMVLLQDKNNQDARYFLALRLLQDGKTSNAMQEMKALYHSLPDDSPLKKTINQQIGRD